MKNICILVALGLLVMPTCATARLGDTVEVAEKRYGKPTNDPAGKFNPLIKNVINEMYKYKGWMIRVAYINDHAVRMLYARELKPGQSPFLQDYEIKAILKAEAHGGAWETLRKKSLLEEAIFKTDHPNKMFVYAKSSWRNSNGCIAYSPNGMSLYVESPAAMMWESTMANAKVQKRKQDVPDF
jgi:hypothetical protein